MWTLLCLPMIKMTWKCKLMGYYFEGRCLASSCCSCQLECQRGVVKIHKLASPPRSSGSLAKRKAPRGQSIASMFSRWFPQMISLLLPGNFFTSVCTVPVLPSFWICHKDAKNDGRRWSRQHFLWHTDILMILWGCSKWFLANVMDKMTIGHLDVCYGYIPGKILSFFWRTSEAEGAVDCTAEFSELREGFWERLAVIPTDSAWSRHQIIDR